MKKIVVLMSVAALILTGFVCSRCMTDDGDGKVRKTERKRAKKAKKGRIPGPVDQKRLRRSVRHDKSPRRDLYGHLPERERKLVENVQDRLDADDFAGLSRVIGAALASTNAEVRLHAVEALGWFGEKALVELTPCMADENEDVAEAARNAWELGLSEVESAQTRLDVSIMAFGAVLGKDSLETIGGQLSNAASEVIDNAPTEEMARRCRVKVLESLCDMIRKGDKDLSEAAKNVYEEITGYEWRGTDEADRYLRNPEGYALPEDETD